MCSYDIWVMSDLPRKWLERRGGTRQSPIQRSALTLKATPLGIAGGKEGAKASALACVASAGTGSGQASERREWRCLKFDRRTIKTSLSALSRDPWWMVRKLLFPNYPSATYLGWRKVPERAEFRLLTRAKDEGVLSSHDFVGGLLALAVGAMMSATV